ncbi:unnamed protein product [Symbiodinium natans]|uniref:Uncharacterized protein n=1 Tax=Symbiodinium natans TaxID=878477 RepID=A0A812SBZ5_9DINO|nr:unnamed protein product [Symbiodinium natans]
MCAAQCACAVARSSPASAAPEEKVEDQLSTRTASSSSFPRTGSSRDEESPGPSPGSAAAALLAAVLAATGREAKVAAPCSAQAGDKPESSDVKELYEALQDVQQRTKHLQMKIRIAAEECHALEQKIEGLALAHRRRELQVSEIWQDVEAGMASVRKVLLATTDPAHLRAARGRQERPEETATELERLQKEVRRQAVAIQVLRQWHDEAEARHPKTRIAVLTAQLAEERRRRSKEIQQEMDEIARLEGLRRALSGAA